MYEVCLCVVLCWWFEPLPAELPWYIAQLVERSPRLQSVMGSNPTQGSSFFFLPWNCLGCSWFVCCAFAFRPRSSHDSSFFPTGYVTVSRGRMVMQYIGYRSDPWFPFTSTTDVLTLTVNKYKDVFHKASQEVRFVLVENPYACMDSCVAGSQIGWSTIKVFRPSTASHTTRYVWMQDFQGT